MVSSHQSFKFHLNISYDGILASVWIESLASSFRVNTQWIHVRVLHHICTQVWLGNPSYLLLPFMVGQSCKEVGALAQFGLTTKSNLFPCRYLGFMICCMFKMQYKCGQVLPALKNPPIAGVQNSGDGLFRASHSHCTANLDPPQVRSPTIIWPVFAIKSHHLTPVFTIWLNHLTPVFAIKSDHLVPLYSQSSNFTPCILALI